VPVTIAEAGGHDTEFVGHDVPNCQTGHDGRNTRSRCRNGRSRWAEIRSYSLLAESQQLFASRYQPWLPTEAELQAELNRDRALLELARGGEGAA